jgi:Dimethlysulfonioproprionate lyase
MTPAEAFAGLTATVAEIIAGAFTETREPELAIFRERLEVLWRRPKVIPQGRPTKLSVCRYFPETLDGATGKVGEIGAALRLLHPFLSFAQNPNYRRAPPTPSFLANYGYAVLAGPDEGAPALVSDPDLAFGVLLLGPRTEYPAHHHPAAELYVPLSRADWAKASAAGARAEFVSSEPGSVIHHPPNMVHATRTRDTPLAALYLWAGDLATHARLAD